MEYLLHVLEFWRIKIYISLKRKCSSAAYYDVLKNQNLHISQTWKVTHTSLVFVLKNQNLHISQTCFMNNAPTFKFWRIKIYISLKLKLLIYVPSKRFEESKFTYLSNVLRYINKRCVFWRIKIYISLKLIPRRQQRVSRFEESKFTYLSNTN